MQILIAENAGFCYGVERAYQLALAQKGQKIYLFGPLIHNPQIIQELEQKGLIIEENQTKFQAGDTVIIRAHGISQKTKKSLLSKKVHLIDGTCPFVQKSHLIAQQLVKEGCQLVIIGNRDHPEIQGIQEDFPSAQIVNSVEEAENLTQFLSPQQKLGVICQTTIQSQMVNQILDILRLKFPVQFKNTICNATVEKQTSAQTLAQKADVMLVVGGRNSNNTQMLLQICQKFCPAHLISTPAEIDLNWLKNTQTVGITGGASTPLKLIEAVKEWINGNKRLKPSVVEVSDDTYHNSGL